MLMVIFGAGASYDSDVRRPVNGPRLPSRPPLTEHLVGEHYRQIANEYPASVAPGPVITFERVLPFAPYVISRVDGQPEVFGSSLYLRDPSRPLEPESLTRDQVTQAMTIFFRGEIGDPIALVGDYRAKAHAANELGDFAGAVTSAATATEILIDHTVNLLLYEDGCSPAAAVKIWKKTITKRVDEDLAPTLGKTKAFQRAIQRWKRNLAWVRNDAVHTGQIPSRIAASRALDEYDAFTDALNQRLIVKRNKYPGTTLFVCGRRRVDEAGKYSGGFRKHVERLRSGAERGNAVAEGILRMAR